MRERMSREGRPERAELATPERHEEHEASVLPPARATAPRPLPRHGGKALPPLFRARMERSFDADFAAVRVHQGPQAAAIGARAFACGEHLFFAPGRLDLGTRRGQHLVAHELGHVVQQRAWGVADRAGRGPARVVQHRHLETAADAAASSVLRGRAVDVAGAGRMPVGLGPAAAVQGSFTLVDYRATAQRLGPEYIEGDVTDATATVRDKAAQKRVQAPINALTRDGSVFVKHTAFNAGHVIATKYGGNGGEGNLIPMTARFNTSTYPAQVENPIKAQAKAGEQVHVTAQIEYPSTAAQAFSGLTDNHDRAQLGLFSQASGINIFHAARRLFTAIPNRLRVEAYTLDDNGLPDEDVVDFDQNPRRSLGDVNQSFNAAKVLNPDLAAKAVLDKLGTVQKSIRYGL